MIRGLVYTTGLVPSDTMSRWQNAVGAGVGYWMLSGTFNAVTGALDRHLAGWLAAGVAVTAVAALTDVARRREG